jgi:hypothetical protein
MIVTNRQTVSLESISREGIQFFEPGQFLLNNDGTGTVPELKTEEFGQKKTFRASYQRFCSTWPGVE